MLWLLFSFLVVLWLYTYITASLSYWKRRNVVSEKPWPLFGNLLNIALRKKHFWSMINRMYNESDEKLPYFGIYLSHKPVIVIKDRNMIKKVLITNFNSFANRTNSPNEKVDPFISNTLFVLQKIFWRPTRRKLTPSMTTGKMKEMLPLMAEVANNMEQILGECDEENVDLKDILKKFCVDVTFTSMFGVQSESLKNKNLELRNAINEAFDPRQITCRFRTFCWVFWPMLVNILRLPFFKAEKCRYLMDIYLQTEEERKGRNIHRYDVMNHLMELSNNTPKFDDGDRIAQALQFLITGTEAPAFTAALCLYELALNPKIQENLRHEIWQNLDSNGNVPYDALMKMELLDMVTKETMRMYLFLPFITRYTQEEYTFESTGLTLEKNTQVIIPSSALHFDPKYYPEPSKFDPERYRRGKKQDIQYVFLPFGVGPRKCVGERLSLMIVKLGIATILKEFEVLPGEKTDIPLKFAKNTIFSTTVDGSIWLKVKRIDKKNNL